MKIKYLFISTLAFILISCDTNDVSINDDEQQRFVAEWHLSKVSGGSSDVDISFETNSIIWTFLQENSELIIENNNDNTQEDGLDTGSYFFTIFEVNEKSFLVLEGEEYGQLISSNEGSRLTINQNLNSSETFSDLYTLTFERKLVPINNTDD